MQNLIKQIREERELEFENTGQCLVKPELLDGILDALAEAERKAEAGEELAEALSGSPYRDGKTLPIEGTDSYWEEWRDRLLYTYNKTVNE